MADDVAKLGLQLLENERLIWDALNKLRGGLTTADIEDMSVDEILEAEEDSLSEAEQAELSREIDHLDSVQGTILDKLAAQDEKSVKALASGLLFQMQELAKAERGRIGMLEGRRGLPLRLTLGLFALYSRWDHRQEVPSGWFISSPYFWDGHRTSDSALSFFFRHLHSSQTTRLMLKCMFEPHKAVIDNMLYRHPNMFEVIPHVMRLFGSEDNMNRVVVLHAVKGRFCSWHPISTVLREMIDAAEDVLSEIGNAPLQIGDTRPSLWCVKGAAWAIQQASERVGKDVSSVELERLQKIESQLLRIWPEMFLMRTGSDFALFRRMEDSLNPGPFHTQLFDREYHPANHIREARLALGDAGPPEVP